MNVLTRDTDRSAGISCAATDALGCPGPNPHVTHHERPIATQPRHPGFNAAGCRPKI
jgi:hypothetical protein